MNNKKKLMQQIPMRQIPMRQIPMQQIPIQQIPIQQIPIQQIPILDINEYNNDEIIKTIWEQEFTILMNDMKSIGIQVAAIKDKLSDLKSMMYTLG